MAVSIFNGSKQLLSSNLCRLYKQVRTGYIVLLPEVDPDKIDKSPLYKSGLPDTAKITSYKCIPTLGSAVLDFEGAIREVENDIIENTDQLEVLDYIIEPLEEKNVNLESIWGLAKVVYLTNSSIIPPETYLSVHERARKARSSKFNSRIIYNAFKKCDKSKFTEEEQRVVGKYLTEGKLNGLDLGNIQREAFKNASIRLAKEKESFRKRVQASSKKFAHTIHVEKEVQDFPKDLLAAMARKPEESCSGPWDLSLDPYVASKFLEFSPDRNMRWNLWIAGRQVASNKMGYGAEYSNSVCLEQIRSLRFDIAKILGYESYAHMSMETKMAGSIENVKDTLTQLLEASYPMQKKELDSLEAFAQENGFKGVIEMWDIKYWGRKQRNFLYHWDDTEIKDFFPFDRVFSGLLKITSEAFGLRFEYNDKHTAWHPDIKLYNVYESESKRPIAGLYVDPYSRDGKVFIPEGIMTGIRPACRALGSSPSLAALIFNFSPPRDGKPTLLTFDDVEIVFAKFGQALQQLLSSVSYSDVSGMSTIEWDAVEVVSNFMSHWMTEPNVLKEISGHYASNEALPIDNIKQTRKHLIGHKTVCDLYYANLDLDLHLSKDFWLNIVKNVWSKHFTFSLDPNDAHPLNFMDSACGQFSAAYFSKIWAQMLAADAFNTFITEFNDPSSDVGSRFRDTFLGFGGSVHPSEVFRRFQGRDPTPEAFIKYISS